LIQYILLDLKLNNKQTINNPLLRFGGIALSIAIGIRYRVLSARRYPYNVANIVWLYFCCSRMGYSSVEFVQITLDESLLYTSLTKVYQQDADAEAPLVACQIASLYLRTIRYFTVLYLDFIFCAILTTSYIPPITP